MMVARTTRYGRASRMIALLALTSCSVLIAPAFGQSQTEKLPGAKVDDATLEKRSNAVSCKGNDRVTLEGVLLRIDGAIVRGRDNCKMTIRNSHIIGSSAKAGDAPPPVAIELIGNGELTIENTIIEATNAVRVAGNTNGSVRSSTVLGRVMKADNAKIADLGGNRWK